MNIERSRHPDATSNNIMRMLLFSSESVFVSSRMPYVDCETAARMLFMEFFRINQTLKCCCSWKRARSMSFSYITAAQMLSF